MSVLFIALPLALLLGAGGTIACIMCIRGGQYDDLESPAVRILIDDEPKHSQSKAAKTADPTQPSQDHTP
ncbi:cbb3-type cytochrome oxidase assembly protein CcoS [Rhodopirellula bahusiensis]|uniref:cbb3-type cytochrome oxidase assembly protein CcoS n=1 Tax=Rhodopirellula bahusiensis TaxID=2014065 RepID=UPI0032649C85